MKEYRDLIAQAINQANARADFRPRKARNIIHARAHSMSESLHINL